MTSECQNCGRFVSDSYVRVFSVDGETVGACPRCPDMVRVGGRTRPAVSDRKNARGVSDGGGQ